MAEVTVTAGYPIKENAGSLNVYIYKITDVDDGETLTTGITNVIYHVVSWTGNPATQTDAGGNSTISGGTITFYPGVDDLGATVALYCKS